MFTHLEAIVSSLNVSPIFAIRISDMLSFAVGVQFQYRDVDIQTALAPTTLPSRQRMEGDDIGMGFVAGAVFTPTDGTTVGIGYRSLIKHSLDGRQSF